MSPRPPGTAGWPWPPPAKQHLPGGPQRAPPELRRVPRGWGDPSISGVLVWVTGMGRHRRGKGGGHTAPTIYLGASAAPPAAQMSPPASRSGYRLRLQLPFIAPVPVPVPSPAPTTPPAGDPGIRAPKTPPGTRGLTPLNVGSGDGGDPAVTCHPPRVPRGDRAAGCCQHLGHRAGDTHGCWVSPTCPFQGSAGGRTAAGAFAYSIHPHLHIKDIVS